VKTDGQTPSDKETDTDWSHGCEEQAGRSSTAAERSLLRISTFCMVLGGGCSDG